MKKKITDQINERNEHYNFFLDNTENPGKEKPVSPEEYQKYLTFMSKGRIFAYTLSNTWTKGKEFFYITKGCVLQVSHVYEDRIFVDVAYKGQVGLMKLEELKIILTDDDIWITIIY